MLYYLSKITPLSKEREREWKNRGKIPPQDFFGWNAKKNTKKCLGLEPRKMSASIFQSYYIPSFSIFIFSEP